MQITWYGHSNFLISTPEVSILIDPFFSGNTSCPLPDKGWKDLAVDMVLVTHDHGDHVGDAIAICQAKKAMCGCVVGTGAALVARGLPKDLIVGGIGFGVGGTWEYKGVKVIMTEALHSSDSSIATGFIIVFPNGFTVYHAGDTGIFCNMALLAELYPIDLALLPIGGFFTMDGQQAARACKLLQPRMVIPMHYQTFSVLAQDPAVFVRHLVHDAPKTKVIELKPGQSLDL